MYNLASDFFEEDAKCLINIENSRLKPVFRYTISICICVGG